MLRGVGGEGGAGPVGYGAAEELAGGGVGELEVGPAEDAADLLELGEGAVGAVDGGLELGVGQVGEHDGDGLGAGWGGAGDDDAGLGCRAAALRAVSRSAGWMFRPAPVTMTSPLRPRKRSSPVASWVGEVAGGEPLAFAGVHGAGVPGGAGEHVAADEDLAFVGEADLAAGEGFADGAAADAEGVVEGDEGGGLGHAVALDEGEAEAVPEGLELRGEGGSAGDDGPELPAESAVDAAEAATSVSR